MTNEMIITKTYEAISKSKKYKIVWLLSNGNELKVVISELMKAYFENHEGYWVAEIYENGHPVEA